MIKRVGVFIAIPIIFLSYYWMVEAYEIIEVADGGMIKGVVKLEGEAPGAEALPMTKDTDFCGKTTPDPRLAISDHNEIENVVVTVEGIGKGRKAVPVQGAVLHHANCILTPHVQAVTIDTELALLNTDPIMHNTHAHLVGKRTVFNLALPLKDQEILQRLKRPGLLSVKCDVGHPWTSAYIYVSKHPYYAVTDESGEFEISGVPPGTYTLKAWHEYYGTIEKKVAVSSKGEVNVGFSFVSK